MKHPDYDWMLFGCHPISDIAMAYCPCEHATSSTRAFLYFLCVRKMSGRLSVKDNKPLADSPYE